MGVLSKLSAMGSSALAKTTNAIMGVVATNPATLNGGTVSIQVGGKLLRIPSYNHWMAVSVCNDLASAEFYCHLDDVPTVGVISRIAGRYTIHIDDTAIGILDAWMVPLISQTPIKHIGFTPDRFIKSGCMYLLNTADGKRMRFTPAMMSAVRHEVTGVKVVKLTPDHSLFEDHGFSNVIFSVSPSEMLVHDIDNGNLYSIPLHLFN